MPLVKQTLHELEEQDYSVVAIHTVLQDHKLAYLLNQNLECNLQRITPDLDCFINQKQAFFSVFECQDQKRFVDLYLIQNKYKIKALEGNSLGLFSTEASFASTYVYLQNEIKEADFVLKIQGEFLENNVKEILDKINKTKGIITAYAVDIQKLNHKEYLIF